MAITLEIMSAKADPKPRVVKRGEIRGDGAEVTFGVDQSLEVFLRKFQFVVGGKTLTHEDGEAWVKQLPAFLRGTYLWAQEPR